MPAYKLTYFNARGRAEVARILFAKAGVAYEDSRITGEQWGQMKDTTPFGSMPVLEVDGVPIAQSCAIATFLAKRFGLNGKTDIEEAYVNMICLSISELNDAVVAVVFQKDEARKAELKKALEEQKVPNFLKFLNRIIEKNGSGFLVGKELTLADISFAHYIEAPKIAGIEVDFSSYPKLKALKAKVEADPKIAKWYKNRPENAF